MPGEGTQKVSQKPALYRAMRWLIEPGRGHFSADGRSFRMRFWAWGWGVVLLVFFTWPNVALYLERGNPGWIIYCAIGFVDLVALWCLGYFRRAHFSRALNRFSFEEGWIFPCRRLSGRLSDIQAVIFFSQSFMAMVRGTPGYSQRVRAKKDFISFKYQGKVVELIQNAGQISTPEGAQKLSELIKCEVYFNAMPEE
ncbi:MAG: hypothetical protein ABIJ56_14780 [Pseudomonadota bacterium]